MRKLVAALVVIASALAPVACTKTKAKGARAGEPNENSWMPMRYEGETFGRFVGTLHHDALGKDQLAKLDFITGRVSLTNTLSIRAVLTVYFGGMDSGEYVSYHYEDVTYNLLTSTLVFNQNDQYISLATTEFSAEGLVATVNAGTTKIGTLTLNRDAATPSAPVIAGVAGEYTGQCEGKATSVHLWTSRNSNDSASIGNPFGTLTISGTVGDKDSQYCGLSSADKTCVVDVIRGGSYDFFAATMKLTGQRRQYDCRVDGGRLDCGICNLSRVDGAPMGAVVPATSSNVLIEDAALAQVGEQALPLGSSAAIAGEYFGFVHHELLDAYQPAKITIQTFQVPDGSSTRLVMAATAQLFFTDDGMANPSSAAITYSFNQREYDLRDQVFVFERMAEDVDAILQVNSIGDGKIRGVWNSLHFGRVGTFELQRDHFPGLRTGARPFKAIGGTYRAGALELSLIPRLDATPVNSLNPFFPLVFGGRFRFPGAQSEWVQIEDGSYDFYTGKVGVQTAAKNQYFAGRFDAVKQELKATKASRAVSTLQEIYVPDTFSRVQ